MAAIIGSKAEPIGSKAEAYSKQYGRYSATWRNWDAYIEPGREDDEAYIDTVHVIVQFYKDGQPTYQLANNNYYNRNDDEFMLLD